MENLELLQQTHSKQRLEKFITFVEELFCFDILRLTGFSRLLIVMIS